MGLYRKKPVIIHAFQFLPDDGGNFVKPTWLPENSFEFCVSNMYPSKVWRAQIKTLEGTMHADVGDWIIKGVKGEIYPCKPDIFEATYEPA